jgi:hypothetical protein
VVARDAASEVDGTSSVIRASPHNEHDTGSMGDGTTHKDLATDEDSSFKRDMVALRSLISQLSSYLVTTISNEALKMIEEWHKLKTTLLTDQDADLGTWRSEILLRYGLPYKHHFKRPYSMGMPIPRSSRSSSMVAERPGGTLAKPAASISR